MEQPTDNPNEGKTPEGQGFTVDMSTREPLYPTVCPRHIPLPDPSDETDGYVAYMCPVCKRGYLKRKS